MLATASQMLDDGGLTALTVEAVAARSGVAKSTIYRHWSNAMDLALAALLHRVNIAIPDPDCGSLREDLRAQLRGVLAFLNSRDGTLLIELLGHAQSRPELKSELFGRFYAPRRATTIALLRRGQQRGQLPGQRDDEDLELLVDVLIAPLYYQHLIGRKSPTGADVDRIVALVLADPVASSS